MKADPDPALDRLAADPHEFLRELRRTGPVAWVEALGGWVVVAYDTARRVMLDSDTFTVDDPRFTTAQVIGPSMLSLDGDEHARHRQPFATGLRRRQVRSEYEARAVAIADRLVEEMRSRGHADLRHRLASPLATQLVLHMLGLDEVMTPGEARRWYDHIAAAVTEASAGHPHVEEGRRAFDRLADAVAMAPRTHDGIVTAAAATLTEAELAANVAVMLFGGIETGEAAIANLLWHVFTSPAGLAAITADPSLIPRAVEESLRLEPAATRVDRYATHEVTIAGTTIATGDLVIVSLAAANRDPAVFEAPDDFKLDRPNHAAHLTFASGPHVCPGASMARAESAAALTAVMAKLPGAELTTTGSTPPRGLVFRKPDRLTFRWDAGLDR